MLERLPRPLEGALGVGGCAGEFASRQPHVRANPAQPGLHEERGLVRELRIQLSLSLHPLTGLVAINRQLGADPPGVAHAEFARHAQAFLMEPAGPPQLAVLIQDRGEVAVGPDGLEWTYLPGDRKRLFQARDGAREVAVH